MIPAHVLTFLYYNQSFGAAAVNAQLTPAFMAAHADFVESSGFDHRYVNAFKMAGGRFAVTYVDPTYVPYCIPPFTRPAGRCKGQIGDLNPDESAWFHDSSGARVHRPDAYTGEYQEFLNPATSQARQAVKSWMDRYLAGSPSLDLFFADDSGSTWNGPDGSSRSGMFYGFNAPGIEVSSDSAWIAGENALFSAAPRGLILNGGDGFKPAYDGRFLQNKNVIGSNHEGCFNSAGGGRVSDANGMWKEQANGLLADLPFGKYSLCMMNGPPLAVNRLYALASWWLTYEPAVSVAAPVAPANDGNAVFAEFAIVPRNPRQSASRGDIRTLQRDGVYVREFEHCFQNGASIGACAALVNPTTVPRAMPPVAARYARWLKLDDTSLASGGVAAWRPGRSATIGPLQGMVLKQ